MRVRRSGSNLASGTNGVKHAQPANKVGSKEAVACIEHDQEQLGLVAKQGHHAALATGRSATMCHEVDAVRLECVHGLAEVGKRHVNERLDHDAGFGVPGVEQLEAVPDGHLLLVEQRVCLAGPQNEDAQLVVGAAQAVQAEHLGSREGPYPHQLWRGLWSLLKN